MVVKTERVIELAVLLALFLVVTLSFPALFAFTGDSTSFDAENKFDAVTGSEEVVISSSFTQRFIGGGNQPVANTTSATTFGRLGIMFEEANASVALISPANDTDFVDDGVNNITFTYIYGGGSASNCSLVLDNVINQTTVSPSSGVVLSFNQVFNISNDNQWSVFCHIGSLISAENRTFDVVSQSSPPDTGCDANWMCGNWSVCDPNTMLQYRTCTDESGNDCQTGKPPEVQFCTPCQENWQCGAWGSCINGEQIRSCNDLNVCNTTVNQPALNQSCVSNLIVDYTPQNLTLVIPNGSSVDFDIDATHTISSTNIDLDWFLDGSDLGQGSSGVGNVQGGVSLTFDDLGNFDVEGIVSTLNENVVINWDVTVVDSSCVENWDCALYSFCEDDARLSQPLQCIDLNGCGTNLLYPQPKECTCQISWNCGAWDECHVDYELGDIIEDNQEVTGRQTRECVDVRKCAETNKTEYRTCSVNVSIDARLTEWCEEELIELYVEENNQLVSRIQRTEIEEQELPRIDISFVTTQFAGYCSYCNNGVQDQDEEGVDCGGENCPECRDFVFFDLLFWLLLFLWLLLVILIFVYLSKKRYRHEIALGLEDRQHAVKRFFKKITLSDRREKALENKILKSFKG